MIDKGHESESPELGYEIHPVFYGKLQARKFFNARKSEKEIPSFVKLITNSISLKNWWCKKLIKSGASHRGNTGSLKDSYKLGLKRGKTVPGFFRKSLIK
jgi:hypothetical protein